MANILGVWWFLSSHEANVRIDKIESNFSQISGTGNISVQWDQNSTIQGEVHDSQIYQNSSVQQTITPKTPEEKRADEISQRAKSALVDFYNAINAKNFEKVEKLSDNTFIGDPVLSKNFSAIYLNRFLWTLNGTWKIQEVEMDPDKTKDEKYVSRRGFNYEMYYTLKGGQSYRDKWNAIVKYDPVSDAFFVNSLNCETKFCVNQPFFTLK